MDRKRVIEEILGNFHGIHHMVGTTFRPTSTERDFTYSQMVILGIVKMNAGIGIKELAASLGITSSAATQQVDNLVKKGYLLREGNADDRRSLNLRLSPDLDKQIEEMKAVLIEKLAAFFSVLTDEELTTYAALNQKIASEALKK